jgi:hypothetical protein
MKICGFSRAEDMEAWGEKKPEKLIKSRKLKKKQMKKPNQKKLIKILKKSAGSVRFRFYKQKNEKPNRNRKKPEKTSQTEPKQSQTENTEPKPEKPSQTGLNRFFL